eukprot:scaffold17925_cov56-Attheya_sp.AAC.2
MAFTLMPTQAHQGMIDYSTTEGCKMYVKAITPLQEELYDCIPSGLFRFIKELEDRATDHYWNEDNVGILKIPEDPTDLNTSYEEKFALLRILTCSTQVLDEFDFQRGKDEDPGLGGGLQDWRLQIR